MKWTARVLGIVIVSLALVIAISFALPAQMKHTRVIILKQTPEKVFAVLSDVEKLPTWNRNLQKVEMLPPIDGKEATKQISKNGMTMTIVTAESLAPTHLVRVVREVSSNAFSRSWTYEITPTADGCQVALTEKSDIKNPIFRLMVRIFGSTRYIDQHLVDLAKHFSETPTLRSGAFPARR
jgi:ribosome-associated toxin RatA of RatAB toxin-antitoxin module